MRAGGRASSRSVFRALVDDYSYQVYAPSDDRFWFRLERERDRDIITDYFIGSFPREQGGSLLAECYRVLGLTPRAIIVFRDILSGRDPNDTKALEEARELYAASGKSLLSEIGVARIEEHTQRSMGKVDLVLVGDIDPIPIP
jgi:hypothetical protein